MEMSNKIEGKAPVGATTSLKPVKAPKVASVGNAAKSGSNSRGKQGNK